MEGRFPFLDHRLFEARVHQVEDFSRGLDATHLAAFEVLAVEHAGQHFGEFLQCGRLQRLFTCVDDRGNAGADGNDDGDHAGHQLHRCLYGELGHGGHGDAL